jgi:hypothetical protein
VIYLSEKKLDVDYCGFASNFYVSANTTSTKNSTTRDVPQQWAQLNKLKEFWKTKSCTTTSQTFFAPMNTSSSKVSCSSNLFEQLKCVVYYHVVLVVKLKNCIISYKTTNGIFTLRKHLEENLALLIVKELVPLFSIEAPILKGYV